MLSILASLKCCCLVKELKHYQLLPRFNNPRDKAFKNMVEKYLFPPLPRMFSGFFKANPIIPTITLLQN